MKTIPETTPADVVARLRELHDILDGLKGDIFKTETHPDEARLMNQINATLWQRYQGALEIAIAWGVEKRTH